MLKQNMDKDLKIEHVIIYISIICVKNALHTLAFPT